MNITYIKPHDQDEYSTNIDLVLTKGTRKKAIGKTGHFSQLVKSVASKAPNYYKLYDQDNVLVDHYLSMASLKAGMQRRGIVALKTKKETIAQAYERGLQEGIKQGLSMANEERWEAGYEEGYEEGFKRGEDKENFIKIKRHYESK